jgi:hypothetical protein
MAGLLKFLGAREWRWPAVLLVIGLVGRLAWLFLIHSLGSGGGEAMNIAVAYSKTGCFCHGFGWGGGPTTHMTPSMPIVAGSIYAHFGLNSPASETMLAILAICLSLGSGLLYFIGAVEAGLNRTVSLYALAAYCILPLNLELETEAFRVWEGGLAAFLAAMAFVLMVRTHRTGSGYRALLPLAVVAGVTFFVSPVMGLAVYASVCLLIIRTVQPQRWASCVALFVVTLAIVLSPWVIRNYERFGEFIPLRSNFGLELALAYNDAALNQDQRDSFRATLRRLHPQDSATAFRHMVAAGGEAPYAHALGSRAKQWIYQHPSESAELTARHAFQYYFPPKWHWTIYESSSSLTALKQAIIWLLSLLGLAGAVSTLLRRGDQLAYLALLATVPALPYMIVQPVPRYRYLVFGPLLFLAAALVVRLFSHIRRREKSAGAEAAEACPGR